jgi:ribosomal protein S12 methylthiotransferase
MKTLVYLESLGCAKNQVDSENLISLLESRGFACTNNPGEAALIIVNTCGFIEKAKRESIEISLELKTGFPGKKLIMVGCLAMRYGESLKKELPEIEIIEDSLYDQSFQKKLMNAILPQQPEQKRHSADGGFRSL